MVIFLFFIIVDRCDPLLLSKITANESKYMMKCLYISFFLPFSLKRVYLSAVQELGPPNVGEYI